MDVRGIKQIQPIKQTEPTNLRDVTMTGLVDIRGISPGYNGYSAKYPGADDDVPRVYDDLDDFRPY